MQPKVSINNRGNWFKSGWLLLKKIWAVVALCALSAGRCIAQSPILGEALDATNVVWITGGNAGWFGQTNITHDGVDAARSGAIAKKQQTWIETTVTGLVTVAFWWRVDSEPGFDFLSFSIDGIEQPGKISGFVD